MYLPLLYFGFILCFHKNIQSKCNFFRDSFPGFSSESFHYTSELLRNLGETILPDISQGEPFSDITVSPMNLTSPAIITHSTDMPSSQENDFRPNLPYLTDKDKMILAAGGMIQKQHRDGYRGSGLVVVDILSSPDGVFDTLMQFAAYQDMIPIVKSSKIISSDGVDTFAEFILSKFLLRANVKHTVVKDHRIIKFILYPNKVPPVVREAEGFWHVEVPADRPEGYCRVYLSAQVLTDNMVPPLLLDYAVARALSRATQWMKPFFFMRK